MKITNLFCSILLTGIICTSCSKKDDSPVPSTPNSATLAVNSWSFDGSVSKLSVYGFGWASTDFSPRAGWTDFTTNAKESRAIEISILSKPLAAGKYTVELYTDVHLNKNRPVKLTGNKVGIIAQIGPTSYESIAAAGDLDVSISGGKTNLVFKNVTLKQSGGTKTIIAAGNLQYTN